VDKPERMGDAIRTIANALEGRKPIVSKPSRTRGMPNRTRLLSMVLAAMVTCATNAETPAGLEELPEPPPPPDPVVSGEPLEPDVTIIEGEKETIEEYRINGQLYMIKVIPDVGPSYYLMDSDGDGRLESRMSDLYSDYVIPKWVIFSW
jgi:hypothetical protein